MADIVRFPPPSGGKALPREYRQAIARLQELAVDVSLNNRDFTASCEYVGHLNTVRVDLIPRANLAEERGGNGTYRRTWTASSPLPGAPYGCDPRAALRTLNQAIAHLAGLLGGES